MALPNFNLDPRDSDRVITAALATYPLEDVIANEIEVEDRQLKWDRRFLELAKHVSTWSKDPSTQVGAVIVNDKRVVVGLGFNGFPRGVDDDVGRYNDREIKYKLIVHAEVNAILTAGDRAEGATIYVYPAFGLPPLCSNCGKAVIQAGIKRVVGYKPDVDAATAARWADELAISYQMCAEADVRMDVVPR